MGIVRRTIKYANGFTFLHTFDIFKGVICEMNKEFRRGLLLHKTVSVWRQEKLYESLYLLLLPFALFF